MTEKQQQQDDNSKPKCPVMHDGNQQPNSNNPFYKKSGSNTESNASMNAPVTSADRCPVNHGKGGSPHELIDPKNNMPLNPNQEPYPGQKVPLSTDRVQSNIPKTASDSTTSGGTWLYPSPQMFYNALRRKGKDEDFQEEEADVVVAIHNNMNERTWKQVVDWETSLHGSQPTLTRFTGRPFDFSPKARLKHWFGWPLPFDRHDWYVDRNGQTVRYVIDYYYDSQKSSEDKVPDLHSADAIRSINMDVRPAVDSFRSLIDRLKWFPKRAMQSWRQTRPVDKDPVFVSPKAIPKADEEKVISKSLNPKYGPLFDRMHKECHGQFVAVSEASDDASLERAQLGLNYCMGRIACPNDSREFMHLLESNANETEVQAAYEKMTSCINSFSEAVQKSRSSSDKQ